jgi:hypothetical protein
MKLVRKVSWNENRKRYEVEWVLHLREEEIENKYRVNLTNWYVEFEREEGEDENVYKAWITYTDEDISNVEEDTRRIIEAVKEAVKKAREHESIAERLSTEIEFDVE